MSSSPRFRIDVSYWQYGPRDEYVGSKTYLEEVAYTWAWAQYRCNHLQETQGDFDIQFSITDTRPGEPGGPEPWPALPDPTDWPIGPDDDIPF